MAQLLKVYSDNAPPPDQSPLILRIIVSDQNTPVSMDVRGFSGLAVEWGDGTGVENFSDAASLIVTHQYDNPGEYTLRVWGDSTVLYYPSRTKEIMAWGTGRKTNLQTQDLCIIEHVPPYLPDWMTDLRRMFADCDFFNDPNVSQWDTSNITGMVGTFVGCNIFNQPLNEWNTRRVTSFAAMFRNTSAFNQPLDKWDTSSATSMEQMFSGAHAFNSPVGAWDTSSVENMNSMFGEADLFNQDISGFNVSNVKFFGNMFISCRDFNQDISGWDVSSGINFSGMFQATGNFNKPIPNWRLLSAVNVGRMFYGASVFSQDISGWCVPTLGNIDNPTKNNFALYSPLKAEQLPVWGTCPGNP